MISPALARRTGIVLGAGTVLSAFGVTAPAVAATDCSGVTAIAATEAALRSALDNQDSLICINPGTINLGASGLDSDFSAIYVDYDVTIVGIGNVVFDGDGTGMSAILTDSAADVDLQVESITFQNFNSDSEVYPGVVGATTSGSVTVIDSTFQMNTGYAMVGSVDLFESPDDGDFADIVVSDSFFNNNTLREGAVWGYADITITDSVFVGNDSEYASVVSLDDHPDIEGSTLTLNGNYLADNFSLSGSAVEINAASAFLTNNTFAGNSSYYAVVEYLNESNGVAGFNTFVENSSEAPNPNLRVSSDSEVGVIGNIFVTSPGEQGVDEDGGTLVDQGGNFSTSDDSLYLTNSTSHNSVDEADLALADEATVDGGLTDTFALGEGSIALDAVSAADAEFALEYDLTTDQRGESRGELLDAGAWDDGESVLASTGVDITGIAATAGLFGAAGIALAARRRTRRS